MSCVMFYSSSVTIRSAEDGALGRSVRLTETGDFHSGQRRFRDQSCSIFHSLRSFD